MAYLFIYKEAGGDELSRALELDTRGFESSSATTSCATLGMFNISEPLFPHLLNRRNNRYTAGLLQGLTILYAHYLVQSGI